MSKLMIFKTVSKSISPIVILCFATLRWIKLYI